MRSLISLGLLTIFPLLATSQEVVSSGGSSFVNSSIQLDFTLGELAIETLSSDHRLTQGFHQDDAAVTGLNELTRRPFEVFPNPTTDRIELLFEQPDQQNGTLTLTDVHGKIYKQESLDGMDDNTLSLLDLPAGIYFIQLTIDSDNTTYSPVKIIKQ